MPESILLLYPSSVETEALRESWGSSAVLAREDVDVGVWSRNRGMYDRSVEEKHSCVDGKSGAQICSEGAMPVGVAAGLAGVA